MNKGWAVAGVALLAVGAGLAAWYFLGKKGGGPQECPEGYEWNAEYGGCVPVGGGGGGEGAHVARKMEVRWQ